MNSKRNDSKNFRKLVLNPNLQHKTVNSIRSSLTQPTKTALMFANFSANTVENEYYPEVQCIPYDIHFMPHQTDLDKFFDIMKSSNRSTSLPSNSTKMFENQLKKEEFCHKTQDLLPLQTNFQNTIYEKILEKEHNTLRLTDDKVSKINIGLPNFKTYEKDISHIAHDKCEWQNPLDSHDISNESVLNLIAHLDDIQKELAIGKHYPENKVTKPEKLDQGDELTIFDFSPRAFVRSKLLGKQAPPSQENRSRSTTFSADKSTQINSAASKKIQSNFVPALDFTKLKSRYPNEDYRKINQLYDDLGSTVSNISITSELSGKENLVSRIVNETSNPKFKVQTLATKIIDKPRYDENNLNISNINQQKDKFGKLNNFLITDSSKDDDRITTNQFSNLVVSTSHTPKNEIPEIEVLCINCDGFISLNEIDHHSNICSISSRNQNFPQKYYQLNLSPNKKMNLIWQINSKLQRIHLLMKNKIDGGAIKKSVYPNLVNYIQLLATQSLGTIKIILENNDYPDQIYHASIGLKQLKIQFAAYKQLSLISAISLYLEKCINYAIEKSNLLKSLNYLRETQVFFATENTETINHFPNLERNYPYQTPNKHSKYKESATSIKKEPIEFCKTTFKTFSASGTFQEKPFLRAQCNQKKYFNSPEKNSGKTLNQTVKEWSAKKREKKNYEELRKCFFILAVKIKSRLPRDHAAKTILLSELYEEAFEQDLDPITWENFISEKFEEYQQNLQFFNPIFSKVGTHS